LLATNLQFVKNEVSAKCNETRDACETYTGLWFFKVDRVKKSWGRGMKGIEMLKYPQIILIYFLLES